MPFLLKIAFNFFVYRDTRPGPLIFFSCDVIFYCHHCPDPRYLHIDLYFKADATLGISTPIGAVDGLLVFKR